MEENVRVGENVTSQVGRSRAVEEGIQVGPNKWHVVARHADGTIFSDQIVPNALTDVGRAFIHSQAYRNTSAGTQGARFIAVSTNSGGASAAHTDLAGEITTGGLARAPATTNSYSTPVTTLAVTFTATATHTNVQLMGLYNEATPSGTDVLVHEATITAVTLNNTDTLTVTANLTLQ